MMPVSLRHQRGAILVMTAVIIIVLIGVAALALDIGRITVLRNQMQNAADAAALAAAVELDTRAGARTRAMAAAREALQHDSRFSRLRELLGADALPDEAFTFYCIIGAQFDVDPEDVDIGAFCDGDDDGTGRYVAATDADAHYVRVNLDPALADGRFTLDLIFLPVLELLTPGTATEAAVQADAVAGRQFIQCDYPPMALCDPFEGRGTTFRDAMPLGGLVQLRQQGSNQWSAGNFGFLEPLDAGPGASSVAESLASEIGQGCATRLVTTQTGGMTQATTGGINTRFGVYGPPNPFNRPNAPTQWPPAPNVINFPLDAAPLGSLGDSRFGNGSWDFNAYWSAQHPGQVAPNGWSNLNLPQRWEVYQWEIANSSIPPSGVPAHPAGALERRLITVAVLSCNALGLTGGKKSAVVNSPNGFAKFFLTRQADGPPNAAAYGEYVGWSGDGDSNHHVDIQLYE